MNEWGTLFGEKETWGVLLGKANEKILTFSTIHKGGQWVSNDATNADERQRNLDNQQVVNPIDQIAVEWCAQATHRQAIRKVWPVNNSIFVQIMHVAKVGLKRGAILRKLREWKQLVVVLFSGRNDGCCAVVVVVVVIKFPRSHGDRFTSKKIAACVYHSDA